MKRLLIFVIVIVLSCLASRAQESGIFHNINNSAGLSNCAVMDICQDSEGCLWIATLKGLNRYDGFRMKQFHASDGNNLVSDIIKALEPLGDDILIGTDKGVSKYDLEYERFDDLLFEGKSLGEVQDMDRQNTGAVFIASENGLFLCQIDGSVTKLSDEKYIAVSCQGDICAASGTDRICHISSKGKVINSKVLQKSSVSALHVDIRGAVWIGTNEGDLLCIENITKEIVPVRIPDVMEKEMKYIRRITSDKKGKLWIGTENGLYIYDTVTHSLKQYQKNYDMPPTSISDNAVYSILISNDNLVWIGSFFGGIDYTDIGSGRAVFLTPDGGFCSIKGHATSCMMEDSEERLWFGSEDGGVSIYKPDEGKYSYLNSKSTPHLAGDNVHAIAEDTKGNIWIGNFIDGLHAVSADLKTVKRIPFPSNSIYKIVASGDSLLVGTESGAYSFNITNNVVRPFKQEDIGTVRIDDLVFDHDGNLWICTHFDGVYKYDRTADSIERISESKFIYCALCDSDGIMWFGTADSGLLRYEQGHVSTVTGQKQLMNRFIHGIREDSLGRIWLSTDKGLYMYDKASDILTGYTISKDLISNQFNYNSSMVDSHGRIYFGSINGVCRLSPEGFGHEKEEEKINLAFSDLSIFNMLIRPGEDNGVLRKSFDRSDEICLKHNQNSFSFSLTPILFKTGVNADYVLEYHLSSVDKGWVQTQAKDLTISYTNLSKGRYVFETRLLDTSRHVITSRKKSFIVKAHPLACWPMIVLYSIILAFVILTYLKSSFERAHDKMELQLNEQRIKFFTFISHEFKTPLAIITAILGPLSGDDDTQETLSRSDIRIISKNTKRLQFLIKQLLSFRSLEAGAESLTYLRGDIVAFLENCYTSFAPVFRQKELVTNFRCNFEKYITCFDGDKMEKLFCNILSNAGKHADNHGKVECNLNIDEASQSLILSVFNTGSYIPEDKYSEVLQPFFKSSDNRGENSGIGLALVNEIAGLMNGHVEVKSMLNAGTTFSVTIPIVKEAGIDEAESPSAKSSGISELVENTIYDIGTKYNNSTIEFKNSERFTVLVAEDNIDFNELVSRNLRVRYNVLQAADGEEAKAILLKNKVDILISDINMPGMNGFELCGFVKSDTTTAHIPVVLFTYESEDFPRIEGLEKGADAYIEKPFSIQELQVIIRNLLSAKDRIRSHYNEDIRFNFLSGLSNREEEFIKGITDYIVENVSDPELDVNSLARFAKMSHTLLYNKLKESIGMSASDLITHVKMELAVEQLAKTDLTISEISWKLGFNSPNYFTRLFKKTYNCTPKEFRNSHKNKETPIIQ